MTTYTDVQLERLWIELEDVTFIENIEGELVLGSDWLHFAKETSQIEIWKWFNQLYTLGLSSLYNKN